MPQNYHMYLAFIQKPYSSWGPKNLKKSLILKYHGQTSKTDDPSFGDFSWSNYNDRSN